MEKEKNTYIPPILTVVEFKTERGYAESSFSFQNTAQRIDMFVMTESGMVTEQNDGDGNLAAGYMEGNQDYSNASSGSWQYSNGGWF